MKSVWLVVGVVGIMALVYVLVLALDTWVTFAP